MDGRAWKTGLADRIECRAAWETNGPDGSAWFTRSDLGAEKGGGLVCATRVAHSFLADNRPVDEADGDVSTPTATTSQGVCTGISQTGDCATPQPSVDSGFQRVVSCWQRGTSGTIDGAGFVQSLRTAGLFASGSALGASKSSIYKAVSRTRDAGSDPGRQRRTVCLYGACRAFAFERMVGEIGNTRGVHPSGSSARQRFARTVSSCDEERDHAASCADFSWTAASHHSLAAGLQQPSSARVVGTENSCPVLSEKRTPLFRYSSASRIPCAIPNARSSKQWRDSLEREKAIYRRSFREAEHCIEAIASRRSCRLLHQHPDWAPARQRSRGDASSSLSAPQTQIQKTKSVTYVLSSNCYPCVVTVPHPDPLPFDKGRGRQSSEYRDRKSEHFDILRRREIRLSSTNVQRLILSFCPGAQTTG